ncbi:hypothetical protein [Flavobacterium sp. ACN6]|uniref:putative polyvalent protein kinase domain-containing protein n=1 Tax=Flavobacterium sp. ACN6 TaxID=1920426 RepID=UPI001DC25577|nr:hypothetical protein [Flavobacterium sp. ACN6]PBJ12185.1 hypothetical protein BSF42_21400 [Flavobacterium sp. ACN6]
MAEGFKHFKKQEKETLEQFIDLNNLWILDINLDNYTKNNDYYNPDLGIILEDLHDENVLTENGILQFIDTVFYIKDNFYEN